MSDNILSTLPKVIAGATFAIAASVAAVNEEYNSRHNVDNNDAISTPSSKGKVIEVSSVSVAPEAPM